MTAIFSLGCSRVETTQPEQRSIVDVVFASGHVVAENEYRVTANTEGYLVGSFVEEGQPVEAEAPLFQLSNEVQSENLTSAKATYQDAIRQLQGDSPERSQLELQIKQAQSQLKVDELNFNRYQRLVESNAVSRLEFDNAKLQYENARHNVALKEKALEDWIKSVELNAKNTKAQLMIQQNNNTDHFLQSKIDGVVLQIYKQPGELVMKGETVALIGGGRRLARLNISEEDILNVKLHQKVVVRLNIVMDQPIQAIVSKIYPSFDEADQSFIVDAEFTIDEFDLFHNSQLQANIIIDEREDALVIPAGFLAEGDSVLSKEGQWLSVSVGMRNENWVEIREGLKADQTLKKPSTL